MKPTLYRGLVIRSTQRNLTHGFLNPQHTFKNLPPSLLRAVSARGLATGDDDERYRRGSTAEDATAQTQEEGGESKAKLDRALQASQLDEIEKQESAGAPIPESLHAQSKDTIEKDKQIEEIEKDKEKRMYHVWGFTVGGDGNATSTMDSGRLQAISSAARELLLQLQQLNDVETVSDQGRPVPNGKAANERQEVKEKLTENSPTSGGRNRLTKYNRHEGFKKSHDPFNLNNLFRISDSLFPGRHASLGTPAFFRDTFKGFDELQREFFRDPFHHQHHHDGALRWNPVHEGSTQLFVMWSSNNDEDQQNDESDFVENVKNEQQRKQEGRSKPVDTQAKMNANENHSSSSSSVNKDKLKQ